MGTFSRLNSHPWQGGEVSKTPAAILFQVSTTSTNEDDEGAELIR